MAHAPHLRPSLSLNLMLPHFLSTTLYSEVFNDFDKLCSELSLKQTNQRRQCTFVPPVNLLYQTAINVSVDQVIKPRRFVCFISRLTGMGNSDTHTHTHTYKDKLHFYLLISVPVITHCTERTLQNFIFLSSCGKTQLDSKTTVCPSPQLRPQPCACLM